MFQLKRNQKGASYGLKIQVSEFQKILAKLGQPFFTTKKNG
jgi:hypothetical protein